MRRLSIVLALPLALGFLLTSTGCHRYFDAHGARDPHDVHDVHDVHDAHGRGSYYHDVHYDTHHGAHPPPPPTYVPAGYGPRGMWVWDPRRAQYYWAVY